MLFGQPYPFQSQLLNLTPLVAGSAQFSSALNVVPRCGVGLVVMQCNFTLGTLTNVVLTPQCLGSDGNWYDYVALATAALVASTFAAIGVIVAGTKQVRMKYVATGTVTSSALVVNATMQQ